MARLIVKTMRHLMADHRAHRAEVDCVISVHVEERRLRRKRVAK